MQKKRRNLVVGIYFHPEAYPPTLNALDELSGCFDNITIVHRPHLKELWKYPENVVLVPSGKYMDIEQQQVASFAKKIQLFLKFLSLFYKYCRKKKPDYILIYDSISLFAYHLMRPILFFKHKTWYHNHDVLERRLLRKYSIGYYAAKFELKAFKYLHVFSLPSNDRKKFFPMHAFNGKYFFIPNFPSKKFYSRFYKPQQLEKMAKILFQGKVAPFRGIEQIISLLAECIEGHQMELGLIGPCDDEYKADLINLCEKFNVSGKVHFDRLPYVDLPNLTASYQVGIALLSQQNIMTTTIGTASNKIYEYAALGLPVIYYNSENLNQYLGKYSWALGADISSDDIRNKLASIFKNYKKLSEAAHDDFIHELNFETGFIKVKSFILNSMLHSNESAS